MKRTLLVLAILVLCLVFYQKSQTRKITKKQAETIVMEKAINAMTPSSDLVSPATERIQPTQVQELNFAEAARSFAANQLNLNGLEKNKERIHLLAQDERAVIEARQTLLDLALAKEKFGADQAAARVMAIKILSERAHLGIDCDLNEVAIELGSKFENLDVGQRADLRDLVTEMIDVAGIDRFFADPSVVMQTFRNPGEIRMTVIAASVAHIGDQINDPQFVERMRRWR